MHNSFNKTDLHDSFKYISGFLDTDCSNCPDFRYDSVEPLYSKQAQLLELFKKAFKGIKFFIKTTVGDVNSSNTKEALNIKGDFPLPATV